MRVRRNSKRDCTNILSAVQRHYAALFEDAPELGTDTGSLVFTGGEDDPETIDDADRPWASSSRAKLRRRFAVGISAAIRRPAARARANC